MKLFATAGVTLMVLGLLVLVYQGITYTSRETIVDIGPLHAAADTRKTLPLSPILGIAATAGGVALLITGVHRHA